MTTLLQHAVAEAEKLPQADQDAIAARLLAEIEDERQWSARFAKTTVEQWDRIAARVREEIAAAKTEPLENILRTDEPSP